jgi:NADPH-dependent curcumin reductase CurA
MDYNPVSISQSRDVAARVTGRLISRLVTGAVLGFHGLGGVNAYPALADIGSVKENEKRDTVVVEGIDGRGLVGLDWPLLESI